MPALAHLAAATDVRHCRDCAAIDHAKDVRVEEHVDGDSVGAVAVQIERSGTIELRSFQAQDRDRNLHPVRSYGVDLFHLILLGIVPAGYFLLLQQS